MKGFEKLYQENYGALFNVALKMLSDKDAAMDIIHDVFMAFYESGSKSEEVHNPKGYLIKATLNKCIDYRVKRKKIDAYNAQESIRTFGEEDMLHEKEMITRALSTLRNDERKIAVLYSEGYSYKEISEITEIKFTSVGKTLSRILIKLKGALKTLDYELSER